MSDKHKEQIAIACWMSDLIYDFQTDFSSLSWYLSLRLRDAVLEAATLPPLINYQKIFFCDRLFPLS